MCLFGVRAGWTAGGGALKALGKTTTYLEKRYRQPTANSSIQHIHLTDHGASSMPTANPTSVESGWECIVMLAPVRHVLLTVELSLPRERVC